MRKHILLGATEDNELVFADYEVTERNGYPEFSASFDTVRPFNGNDVDLECYFEDYADPKCMDATWIIDRCNWYDCSPQNLPKRLAEDCSDPRDAMDCSLYNEEYEIDGDYWYFESCGCGQHDTRGTMEVYVDESAYNDIHELWDKYHLKKVDKEEILAKLESIEQRLDIDEEEWIESYIREKML